MVIALLILAVLYAATCVFFTALVCWLIFAGGDFRNQTPRKAGKTYADEQRLKEIRRRQRELLNFFNYDGGIMPDADEERQD
jgi:hypothetical protein